MLKRDHYEIIKFFIEINEEKRQEHIQQTKDNPLTRWKVQEYSNVLPTDIYLKDMRQFIKMIKHGKSLIIPKEKKQSKQCMNILSNVLKQRLRSMSKRRTARR